MSLFRFLNSSQVTFSSITNKLSFFVDGTSNFSNLIKGRSFSSITNKISFKLLFVEGICTKISLKELFSIFIDSSFKLIAIIFFIF